MNSTEIILSIACLLLAALAYHLNFLRTLAEKESDRRFEKAKELARDLFELRREMAELRCAKKKPPRLVDPVLARAKISLEMGKVLNDVLRDG